ncbi:MAG TPA: hypothetical protein VHB25_00230 [Gemmatimonadaceae bacterium]|nr:hypothetical protein [Gemmatimonadaceae bacterium]
MRWRSRREDAAPSQDRVLRRLFLMLFLRGRSARQLRGGNVPKSMGWTLRTSLIVYVLIGSTTGALAMAPLFTLAVYLHAMTFVLVGLFVAASAGEVLFNAEEADILLHRPVDARALLRAKVAVLLRVSLWTAVAFNVVGLGIGAFGPHGSWMFLPAHLVSLAVTSIFCAGAIVLTYQLCLRWFGRERLDGLMTTMQIAVSMLLILGSQLLPQLLSRAGDSVGTLVLPWWVRLLPPAWFAGMDDVLTGGAQPGSWVLAAIGVVVTGLVTWLAFEKLAGDYEEGLQRLNEHAARAPRASRRRWLDRALAVPPLSWWLRDPAARASFLLTAAYLLRDRDMKLRVYPAVAPMLVWPVIFLLPLRHSGSGAFPIAFAGVYLGLIPLMVLNLIRFSQNWQAADLFHVVPIAGPGTLTHGARRAVLLLLTAPVLALFALGVLVLRHEVANLALLAPGLLAIPIYAIVPCLGGRAVPCSVPPNSTESARRGMMMLLVMLLSAAWGGLAMIGWSFGFFGWMLAGQAAAVATAYAIMRAAVSRAAWPPETLIG